mmetsp:Transcript_14825/g.17665  ORF Transcript_14825/g.17665 Transcript_14825/m.17665 type:complete len:543 (-) Transcript_14825:38-1666(-)
MGEPTGMELRLRKIGGQQFYLPPHYQPASIVGKGSYGVVISATDVKLGMKVAIKRIKPYCGDEWEARHTLREVRLMRLLGAHPNIISLTNLWTRDEASESELYITMELMDSDLHHIIQSKQQLSEPHHQCLMKQLLLGVQAMHKCGVLHRDLKPGNLLVTRDCQLRITDFGLARAWDRAAPDASEASVGAMTEYVVTRWYRCPELLLAPHLPYDGAIDLWAVGCIFAELINRRPLFPGKSYVHQVQVILDILGTPKSEAELGFKPRDDAATFLSRQRHRDAVPYDKLLPATSSDAAKDFLRALLTWDPKKRLSIDQALAHPWLQNCPALPCPLYPLHELMAHKEKVGINFGFEDVNTPLPLLKKMVADEVAAYRRDRPGSFIEPSYEPAPVEKPKVPPPVNTNVAAATTNNRNSSNPNTPKRANTPGTPKVASAYTAGVVSAQVVAFKRRDSSSSKLKGEGAALPDVGRDKILSAQAADMKGRFGKLEGKAGMGGIPPRKSLPSMPPVIKRGGSSANLPRPGSRQMIEHLSKSGGSDKPKVK